MKKLTAILFSVVLAISMASLLQLSSNMISAQTVVRNFYVTTKYGFGGPGYDVFSPQTLVVQQGDRVNITIRNLGNESFQFNIQGQNSVSIKQASQNGTSIQPMDTEIPAFTASAAGIFTFGTDKFPNMNGELVVLSTDFTSYNPSTQNRNFTQIVMPDFSGDGYDKFIPGVMVVNKGDTINVNIRNTDDMSHGFAIAAYELNIAVNPGQDQPDGSIKPFTTSVQPFQASEAGIFTWFCTTPCGPGHFEMVGQLVVLPTKNTVYNPDITTIYSYLTIKPDFAGNGYSKYLPDTIFANQNDFVYIKVRNTDGNSHGFTMTGYNINNVTISAGNSSDPSQTYIPPSSLYADKSGVFEFTCSYNCGSDPSQMNGYLVVLPVQSSVSPSPTSTLPPTSSSSMLFVELGVALLIIGIVGGIAIAAIFARERRRK
jgi:heme/copper-type cytochrome/quinol oxidase subunit 2